MDNEFEITLNDLPYDIKELVEFGIYTEEEALELYNRSLKKRRKVTRCEICDYKFEPFTHFVIGYEDNGEEVCMCEQCFFDLALDKLHCRSMKMSYNGEDYYDPQEEIGEVEYE